MVETSRAPITTERGVGSDTRGTPGRRQVTVLARDAWAAAARASGVDALPWTVRRANLLIDGIDLRGRLGYDLHVGAAVLTITGETRPCDVMERQVPSLKAALTPEWRGGVTCTVTRPGEAAVGCEVALHREPLRHLTVVTSHRVRRLARKSRAVLGRVARRLGLKAPPQVRVSPPVATSSPSPAVHTSAPARAVTRPAPGPLASIGAISYHLGTLRPIDDLDFLRDSPERLALYKLGGFERYAESDLSTRELAYRSAAQTLDECGIRREDIGICLYVAESFDRDEAVSAADVNRLLVQLGLPKAVPIHVSISNCANIMAALRVATALIRAGEGRHILVVSVDKASRRAGGRRMFQEMSIKSDVSVSCVVSGPAVGPYGILYLNQHSSAELMDTSAADAASYSVPKFKGIRHAAKTARESLGLEPSDFSRIVTNNYSREVAKMFVELCGFAGAHGWFDNIPRFAHAVAGDVLINLKDLDAAGALAGNDRIFIMADSVSTASVLCVQC
jgi:3-oxoacyl-[acyl-carrier-protein] synthase III